jgi:hypothetical protein
LGCPCTFIELSGSLHILGLIYPESNRLSNRALRKNEAIFFAQVDLQRFGLRNICWTIVLFLTVPRRRNSPGKLATEQLRTSSPQETPASSNPEVTDRRGWTKVCRALGSR